MMKKDIGFWNEQGEYIPDIQEVSEVEMKEYNKFKPNEYGQIACNCVEYNNSRDINDTCFKLYHTEDIMQACRVRYGMKCECYKPSLASRG